MPKPVFVVKDTEVRPANLLRQRLVALGDPHNLYRDTVRYTDEKGGEEEISDFFVFDTEEEAKSALISNAEDDAFEKSWGLS